jgi:hypothetical protein
MPSRAFTGVLSPDATDDFLVLAEGYAQYGPEVQKRYASAAQQQLTQAWTQELGEQSSHAFSSYKGISSAQIKIVTATPLVVTAGSMIGVGTGGLGPLGFLTRAYEFGTSRREEFKKYYRKNRSGSRTIVNRRTSRQLPSRSQTGWIAYPAASAWSERVFKMALQILVKVAYDARDKASDA